MEMTPPRKKEQKEERRGIAGAKFRQQAPAQAECGITPAR